MMAPLGIGRRGVGGHGSGGAVHPEVVQVMREVGTDLSAVTPRTLAAEVAARASHLVTMGCGDACPFIPGDSGRHRSTGRALGRSGGVATVTDESTPPFRCVLDAWRAHEAELHAFLIGQVRDASLADDLLQDVFLKAVREGARFCGLDSPRAWLFQVTRHVVIDQYRLRKPTVPVVDALPAPESVEAPLDALSSCLAHALEGLEEDDRDVVQRCDLEGQTQPAYAEAHGLGVPAVKARIQRARARLRQRLIERCGVRFDADGHVCCHGHCHPPPA